MASSDPEIVTATFDSYNPAIAAEIGALMPQLDQSFSSDPLSQYHFDRHFAGNSDRSILIATAAGHVVGTAVMQTLYEQAPQATSGYMGGFVVDKAYRGSGAAAALWGQMHAWCRPRDLYTFAFNTETTRPAAIRFYEKMGAKLVPGTVGHYTVEVMGETKWNQFLKEL